MDVAEPSQTARRVAAMRLAFPRVPAPYGDPAADVALARDISNGLEVTDSPLRAYLEARTWFFDTVVVESIELGISQILVGAAGYDGRAWRFAKPGVSWFELDHPATQRDKLARLSSIGIEAPHVRFVGADFAADPIASSLISAGFDPSLTSLFLLEGVAVYLELSTLEHVLRELRGVAALGSTLAISLSVSRAGPEAVARREKFEAAVAKLGEPARSTVHPGEVDALLSATGWKQIVSTDPNDGAVERRVAAGFVTALAA